MSARGDEMEGKGGEGSGGEERGGEGRREEGRGGERRGGQGKKGRGRGHQKVSRISITITFNLVTATHHSVLKTPPMPSSTLHFPPLHLMPHLTHTHTHIHTHTHTHTHSHTHMISDRHNQVFLHIRIS